MKARQLVENDSILTGKNAERAADKIYQAARKDHPYWWLLHGPRYYFTTEEYANWLFNKILDEYHIEAESEAANHIEDRVINGLK